jgi:hypothetical protein
LPTALSRNLELAFRDLDLNQGVSFKDSIPTGPEEFYKDFGYLKHPSSGELVKELTEYQYEIWRLFATFKRMLVVKSHKVGLTRSTLLADFQLAVLPSDNPLSCRGFDEIILAQTKDLAVEHLRHLRRAILRSKKYSKYLIDRPTEISEFGELSPRAIMRDEKTKTEAIYIHNPDDSTAPTRIIALGADNPGSIESWPNIHPLHISDITATRRDYRESLNIAMSRLANTNGSVILETIPGLPTGPVFEMYDLYLPKTLTGQVHPGDFYVKVVTSDMGVKAGIMTQQFLDSERERDPIAFRRNYQAEFIAMGGNVFSVGDIEAAIELGKQLEDKYGLKPSRDASKSLGADPGFGSSNFGECVVQQIDGVLQVILADEEKLSSDSKTWTSDSAFQGHVRKVKEIYQRMVAWNIDKAMLDGSNASFVRNLKLEFNERTDYENLPEEQHSRMTVQPVAFGKYHKEMLGHTESLMQRHWVAISPKFTKLIDACRTATAVDGKLDKENTLYDDLFDAFRLAVFRFKVVNK